MRLTVSLFLIALILSPHSRADGPLFNTLEASSGEPFALSACQQGDSISGKRGSLSFTFRDFSGNLITPQLDSSSRMVVSETRLDTTNTNIGATNETAAANDTATSGLNGLIKRSLQRLTTLITSVASIDSKLNTLGQKTISGSISVVPASNFIERPTFRVYVQNISNNTGGNTVSIMNAVGSGLVFKIRQIKIINTQTTATTKRFYDVVLRRITSHSGGTLQTFVSHDTADAVPTSLTARSLSTVGGIGDSLFRHIWSSDEWTGGTLDTEALDHAVQSLIPVYEPRDYTRPITIRAGEGLSLVQNANPTSGELDVLIELTQEP